MERINQESLQLAQAVENRLSEMGFSVSKIDDGSIFAGYTHSESGVGYPSLSICYYASNRLLTGVLADGLFEREVFAAMQIRSIDDCNFLIQHSTLIRELFSELFAGICELPKRFDLKWREFLELDETNKES